MTTLADLEKRVEQIEERNRLVEEGKAWETSLTRRALLLLATYGVLGLYMSFAGMERPWINAVVPSTGFWLSTVSLGYLKRFWVEWRFKTRA